MDTQSVFCLYLEVSCLHEFIVRLFISPSNDYWGLIVCKAFCSALGECRWIKTWLQILQSIQSGGVDRKPSSNQRQSAMIWMDRTLWQHKGTWEERRASETSDPGGVDSYLSGNLKVQQDSASRREGAGKAYAEAQSLAINCTDFIYIWPQWIRSLLKVSWDFSDCFMNDLWDTKSSFF